MRYAFIVISVFIVTVWSNNNSLSAPKGNNPAQLIAHRGVHQNFTTEGLTMWSCTAEMIFPPEHGFLENTIPSIRAAIDAGASVNEIDIQRTKDGLFAVFHDHTLDCRTEANGHIGDYTLDDLKQLDIGYGYTSDDGETYPFRGKFIGMMPSLDEVINAFPNHHFILNLKSNNVEDGMALVDWLQKNPATSDQTLAIISGRKSVEAIRSQQSLIPAASRFTGKECLKGYLSLGWMGFIPEYCKNTIFAVPLNYRHLVWGWPHRLAHRMAKVNTPVIVLGPFQSGDPGTTGVNQTKELSAVPGTFDGYIMTDRIEIIGPKSQE
ncbi:MAG: hypothetical protein MRY72_01415 [Aquisalinus sp.]|nr:hypothetical protein [Aquisalinus sp.]